MKFYQLFSPNFNLIFHLNLQVELSLDIILVYNVLYYTMQAGLSQWDNLLGKKN